jgi:hypothetical protein
VSRRSRRIAAASLGAVGAAALVVGLAIAYVTRDEPSPVLALVLLVVGNVLVLGGTGWAVRLERTPDDLVHPAGSPSLPEPSWWFPVGATGLADLAAAPAVSGWLGIAGALLVGVATAGAGRSLLAASPELDRGAVRAARRLRMVAQPGDVQLVGALEPVGRRGVRVVAAGPDGGWSDVMLSTEARARAVAALAGVELADPTDSAFSGAFAVGAGRWTRLPGPRRS